jgi:uncharacterized protein YabE (DUF348 family)
MLVKDLRKLNLSVVILGLFSLFLGFLLLTKLFTSVVFAETASVELSTEEHYVTIFDNTQKTIIKTNAKTVSEALERAKINIDAFDTVEPSPEEEILSESFTVNIYRAVPVIINDNGKRIKAMSAAKSPRDVVKSAGVTLYDEDLVEIVASDAFLETGVPVEHQIIRAAVVNFTFYGRQFEARTHQTTIGALLKERDITISEDDWLSLSPEAKIENGMNLEIARQGKTTEEVEEEIAFKENITYDYDRDKGYREVKTEGEKGRKTVIYEVELKNGVEVSRTKISEAIIKEPVPAAVILGAKSNLPVGSHEDWMRAAGIASSDFGYVEYIISHESGWGYLKSNYTGSGAYGLCQALPGSKMASAGDDWKTNPVTQLKWCDSYAKSRYGSWEKAYKFWLAKKWW